MRDESEWRNVWEDDMTTEVRTDIPPTVEQLSAELDEAYKLVARLSIELAFARTTLGSFGVFVADGLLAMLVDP